MWHDNTSWWLILSIIVYGLILWWAIAAAVSVFSGGKKVRIVKSLVTFTAITGIVGGVFNAATFGISTGFPATSNAPDLTDIFGFKSGQTYPLIAGERFGGSIVDARASRWSFTIKSIPASAISVSFAGSNDKFYIFDIPLNEITFTKREDVEPTMTLNLKTSDINNSWSLSRTSVGDRTPCKKGFKALMLACRSSAPGIRTLEPGVAEGGLSPLVMNYLDNAQMTVTPKMYDRILGKDG